MSQWIACSESMPDDDTSVLIAMADGEVWVGFHDDGQWRYASADPCGVAVTHWMDFPDPPKGEQHGT